MRVDQVHVCSECGSDHVYIAKKVSHASTVIGWCDDCKKITDQVWLEDIELRNRRVEA